MNAQAELAAPSVWLTLGRALGAWSRRLRDRHALAQLTARERRDMGLPRDAVEQEIRKPFWRA